MARPDQQASSSCVLTPPGGNETAPKVPERHKVARFPLERAERLGVDAVTPAMAFEQAAGHMNEVFTALKLLSLWLPSQLKELHALDPRSRDAELAVSSVRRFCKGYDELCELVASFESPNLPPRSHHTGRLLRAALHTVSHDCRALREGRLARLDFAAVDGKEYAAIMKIATDLLEGPLTARHTLVTQLANPSFSAARGCDILPDFGSNFVPVNSTEITEMLPGIRIVHNAREFPDRRLTDQPHDLLLMLAELHADYLAYGKDGICGFRFDEKGWSFAFQNGLLDPEARSFRPRGEGRRVVTALVEGMGGTIPKHGLVSESAWKFMARFPYPEALAAMRKARRSARGSVDVILSQGS